jgi:hypothetical protein
MLTEPSRDAAIACTLGFFSAYQCVALGFGLDALGVEPLASTSASAIA